MSLAKFNLIVATDNKGGIAKDGAIPWKDDPRYKGELSLFVKMTLHTTDTVSYNAVIMGRKTWESIPDKYRPLYDRVNIILTRNPEVFFEKYPELRHASMIHVESSLDNALAFVNSRKNICKTWVIGGGEIYKEALEHDNLESILVSVIPEDFKCDTFIDLESENLTRISSITATYDLYGTPIDISRYCKGNPNQIAMPRDVVNLDLD